MRTLTFLTIAVLSLWSCKNNADQADAYGNFESTDVVISSETSGRILVFDPAEGTPVEKGTVIALIDTTLLHLQEAEMNAGMRSIRTRISSIEAQNNILNQQIENLLVNINRTEKMLKDGAATQKQLDDLQGQESVMKKQILANDTQKSSVMAELALYESKKATLREQIKRSTVRSPMKATIIQKYSEAGEITTAGKPLAKIADISVMKLKVYVSGAQIGNIKLGGKCTIRTDKGEKGYISLPGTISFVSEKAEFTPKIIQTKDERVTLVYAVKIDVVNDGTLKAGMPGEAIFSAINK
jgi:HlyD family secretion protein